MDVPSQLAALERFHTSYLLLGLLAGIGALAAILFRLGVIGWVLRCFGYVAKTSIQIGFRTWEGLFGWASWEQFLGLTFGLLALGVAVGWWFPWVKVACSLLLLVMGASACLAYMFIDLERNEVERGYKAIHNVQKGQRPAENLKKYGKQVRVPLLVSATVAAIGGFAMLNQGLYETVGRGWYAVAEAPREPVYADFLAFSITRVLGLMDVLDLAKNHHIMGAQSVRPAAPPSTALAAAFKMFFTVVLLHQIFASLRQGKLLAETIADFWSPHEPIHERARIALPVYGVVAIDPLLRSLHSVASLTKEQRDQLPVILEAMGPSIIPALARHLKDHNEHVRAISASALGRLNAEASLDLLVARFEDPSEIVRESVVEALGRIGEHAREGGSRKRRFFQRRRRWGNFRKWIRWGRGGAISVPAAQAPIELLVATLESALADDDMAVRIEAVRGLGRTGAPAAAVTPKLIAMSKEGDESLRCEVAHSLGAVGGQEVGVVSALVEMLDDPAPEVKAAAAQALGALGEWAESAVVALAPLLQDREESVRTAAAEAIAKVGPLDQEAAEVLAEGLESPDTVVRAQTAQALGTIGAAAEEAAPALVEAMEDENDRVRAEAVEALGKIGEAAAEAAVPGLIRALDDEDAAVGALAAEALGRMGAAAAAAVPALVAALGHVNVLVRCNAVEALGLIGPAAAGARKPLESAARDEDGGVRFRALLALGKVGGAEPGSTSLVLAGFRDEDPQVRAAAVTLAGRWGEASPEVLAELDSLLEDPNDQVKVEVTLVLPKLAGPIPEVIEGLCRQLLKDDSAEIQANAALALGKLGDAAAAAGEALLRACQTGEAAVREQAMRAIAMIHPPEAAEAFTTGLKDASAEVRILASAGLLSAEAIPPGAVPALIEALADPEDRVRANAAGAIAGLDSTPSEAVPLLIECAAEPNDSIRLNAAQALRKAPAEAVADVMEQLAQDSNARVRLAAVGALLAREAANPTAGAVLVEALADPSPRVREEALEVFESLGDDGAVVLEALAGSGHESDEAEVEQEETTDA